MQSNRVQTDEERELLTIADETQVKTLFREWLADQFSPEKNRENRELNNREEFKKLRRGLRSIIPLGIAYLVALPLLLFLGTPGLILTALMLLSLLIIYAFQALRSARRGVSNRIRENKTKFLRLKAEALFLLGLIPDEADRDDVLEAFKEIVSELTAQINSDKTFLAFASRFFTLGPLTLIAVAYMLNLVPRMDTQAVIEGTRILGTALGYVIAMGLVVAFVNDWVITARTMSGERIAQIIYLAQDIYIRREKPSYMESKQ